MLQCEIGEKTKSTVHVQKKEKLRCRMAISNEKRMYNIKASRAYHLRDLCGGGNSEPNNTLNVKCSEITTSELTKTGNALPASKGAAKDNRNPQHHGEGAASRQA